MLLPSSKYGAWFRLLTIGGVLSETVQLNVPTSPPPGTQIISGGFQGYSMEMASFASMAGNLSHPNKLSYRMLQNLKDITKSAPPIRVGGTTANHGIYIADQEEAMIQNFAVAGADQPANVTWGPAFLESFKIFPKGTKYTVGVTFDSGSTGEKATVTEAEAFYKGIGKELFAMEVGNEFDVFPIDRENTTWNIATYVSQWLNRTTAIAANIPLSPSQTLFQAGAFVAPGTLNNDLTWTAQSAIDLGILNTTHTKTFCTHQYFGAACRPVKPTMADSLMNRTALISQMTYHATASAYTASKGLPYVIGETNSIACQGLAGVSDVFGAAVWSVDYALYAASLNVSALYWHMGTGYRYASWQATRNGTTAPGPRPLYYGNWVVASALGEGDVKVVPIANTSTLAGYAVYGVEKRRQRLRSVVLVNQEIFNSSASAQEERSSAAFELPAELCGEKARAKVQRLTAAGIEVREGMTFGGRIVALDGRIEGKAVKEEVKDGIVHVQASEVALITFD